jgi:hypothetical protein
VYLPLINFLKAGHQDAIATSKKRLVIIVEKTASMMVHSQRIRARPEEVK